MEKVSQLPDGGRLVRVSTGGRGTVVFVGRQNFSAGLEMRNRLAVWSAAAGFGFLIFESPYEAAYHRCDPDNRLDGLVTPLRRFLKGLLFLAHPWAWPFLNPTVRRRMRSADYCAASLRQAIATLPPGPLFLVGHSHGARVATLVADDVVASGVACFGYPFRYPRMAEDPVRVAHLTELKTPCLIVQGDCDAYGGRDAIGSYRLSAAITVRLVAADHECQMSQPQWRAVFHWIDHFFQHTRPAASRT